MPVDKALAFASIRTLGQGLRARQYTSVELTEFYLERLDRLGTDLNAVVTLTRELALEQAARADSELQSGRDRGPLHGIPYGAKDLLATRGIPTTWGAAPYRDRVIDEDATVITRLRDAGAILCAKLAMVEIAGGFGYRQGDASFTGPGRNPWNRETWAGGSSSGSGSAVGGGLVPFAIGSETWGSIVTPAGYCGVTGIRPTYGRVSRNGAMALSWTMDKLGVLCRTAEDGGLVLSAIAGRDPADPSSLSDTFQFIPETLPRPPFRLATIKGAAAKVQPEIRKNYEAALAVLKTLGSMEEIELPDLPYGTVASTIIASEMSAAFDDFVASGESWNLTAPEDRVGGHAGQYIAAKDYINALRIREQIQVAMDGVMSRFDAVVTPALATVSPPLDKSFGEYQRGFSSSSIGGAGNVSGLPCINVPMGPGAEGRPTSIQFVGRAKDELKLFAVAMEFQGKTSWHTASPIL